MQRGLHLLPHSAQQCSIRICMFAIGGVQSRPARQTLLKVRPAARVESRDLIEWQGRKLGVWTGWIRIVLVTDALYDRLVAPAHLQAQLVCRQQGGPETTSDKDAANVVIHARNACNR